MTRDSLPIYEFLVKGVTQDELTQKYIEGEGKVMAIEFYQGKQDLRIICFHPATDFVTGYVDDYDLREILKEVLLEYGIKER